MSSSRLPFDDEPGPAPNDRPGMPLPPDLGGDAASRIRAVDPRFNVALEASAGTGKTRLLVERYINLLRAGVDPANILAMTFTRKAAAEMRARIVDTLRASAARGELTPARWRELHDRLGDIAISTIDAFCLSLLREFPLEADLDPGFAVADDTEAPRLMDEALDRAIRICRGVARDDERVALVFAQLGDLRARRGLAALLSRRLVAPAILSRFLARGPRNLTVASVAAEGARALIDVFASMASGDDVEAGDGLRVFVMSGPADPAFMLFVKQLELLETGLRSDMAIDARLVFALFTRARDYFLTRQGQPRSRLSHPRRAFASDAHWRRHRDLVAGHAPRFSEAFRAYRRDINVLVSGGVWRMFTIAEREYRHTLDAHAVLDFSDLLLRTLDLLRRMEEFARSRYRLEARYHHVLVDEFQDTSRAQWELIALLVESWGQGVGLAYAPPLPPSIFIVGDCKQSIYGFRDADVSVMGDAIRFLQRLRPDGDVRRSIARSFRSVPALLSFVNDVCHDIEKVSDRRDAFQYGDDDRFPVAAGDGMFDDTRVRGHDPALGMIVGESADECARAVAGEIARLIADKATVRDIATGVRRPVEASDIAILFRTRDSHRAFEDALERRRISSYVYKGLGFFDSDEVRDVLALLGFLANPGSNLRAAAFMRSGFVRLSDEALRRLAPNLAETLTAPCGVDGSRLDALDAQSLRRCREACHRWLARVDRIPHSELLDLAMSESAYVAETAGPRSRQARENLKKVRGLVRRAQNKGYATLGRIVTYLDRLAVGDESNAAVDAVDAVNLMTVHAAKGLEFPVVFLVNLSRGTGSRRPPIRVAMAGDEDVSVSVGDFQSTSDEDDPAQEKEETKRLLYVALTRARDRLYLGSVLQDGRLQPGRGSLGEVLPPTLLNHFALAVGDTTAWRASGGNVHNFCVVRRDAAEGGGGEADVARPADAVPGEIQTDFAPLPVPRQVESSATEGPILSSRRAETSERLLGTLVHRLIQRFGLAPSIDADSLRCNAGQLLRADEQVADADVELFPRAIAFYQTLIERPDVRRLYQAGEVWHEVPFTRLKDGVRSRGSIDCVIAQFVGPEHLERLTILEFKTGRERREHLEQVSEYKEVVEGIFPGTPVTTAIVYGEGLTLG
jgi:ATP-dependent helicase/nuclease subunit A